MKLLIIDGSSKTRNVLFGFRRSLRIDGEVVAAATVEVIE